MTGDTLWCAVTSGNLDLILLLLTAGADINGMGSGLGNDFASHFAKRFYDQCTTGWDRACDNPNRDLSKPPNLRRGVFPY